MTRYLLDTTALIDFSKGRQPAVSRILSLIDAGEEMGVCAVNVAEFYSGIPANQYGLWDEFFAELQYWGITRETARLAGQFRYDAARQGRALSTTDMLIAAVAYERGAVIVTRNVKDYSLEGLRVLSWLDSTPG